MYLDRAWAGTKHFWSDNPESDIAEYTVNNSSFIYLVEDFLNEKTKKAFEMHC